MPYKLDSTAAASLKLKLPVQHMPWLMALQAGAPPDNQRQREREHHAESCPANLHNEGLALHACGIRCVRKRRLMPMIMRHLMQPQSRSYLGNHECLLCSLGSRCDGQRDRGEDSSSGDLRKQKWTSQIQMCPYTDVRCPHIIFARKERHAACRAEGWGYWSGCPTVS